MRAMAIVAHPDDETLFLGGFILKNRHWQWTLVTATHSLPTERGREFSKACLVYGAQPVMLGLLDDLDQELDEAALSSGLTPLVAQEHDFVVTHNKSGEYQHRHHKTVGRVVRRLFTNAYQIGYNQIADIEIRLNTWELSKKRDILHTCYPSQSAHWSLGLFDTSRETLISPLFEDVSFDNTFLGRDDFWNYRTDPYEVERLNVLSSKIRALRPRTIVELGCHEGALTQMLAGFAEHVIALDRSEQALTAAKRVGVGNVTLHKLNLDRDQKGLRAILAQQPDVVVASEIMYYLEQRPSVLAAVGAIPTLLVCQHNSRFHRLLEVELVETGWEVVETARDSRFGIGLYRSPAARDVAAAAGERT